MSMTLDPHDLHEALSQGGLDLVYQTQWDLTDRIESHHGRVVGVEVLSRWHHRAAGDVAPDVFIPLAEQGRFLDALDIDVSRRAIRQAAAWRLGGHEVALSVNVAPSHFSTAYADAVMRAVALEDLDPNSLTVEITETPSPQFSEPMRMGLERLRSAGISVSVDDFGAGDVTVEALKTWPIDEVKIDRSLIQSAEPAADALIDELVTTASDHGWRIVAEGIETINDLERSIRRRADRGQGFLWGVPASPSSIAAMLSRP